MVRTLDSLLANGRPPELQGMRVGVLGLARSGRAAAKLLAHHGAHVLVSDSGRNPDLKASAAELRRHGIEVELGGHSLSLLDCDLIVRSPGVPATNPLLAEARKRGLLIVSEIEVAYWQTRAPLIAVTGSNGKTTTAEWLGDMCRRAGREAMVCGNVGFPFSAAVESLSPAGVAVLEISSFQLEDIHLFSPRVAVITNFSPDHLDRYDNYDAYLQAKCRVFENLNPAAALVFNRGDAEVVKRTQNAPGRRLSFGRDQARFPGIGLDGEMIELFDGTRRIPLMPHSALALPGPHNLENALAVACAAWDLGIETAAIVESLQQFSGVPHRLEKVLEAKGVLWVNDSKATNIASGLVALESFTRPLVLLAGGRDKGSDFAGAARTVAAKTRKVILFGEAGELIERAWRSAMTLIRVESLEEAVRAAANETQAGDVVLLSPMCASFDEFKNYEDRGERFKKWVRTYA